MDPKTQLHCLGFPMHSRKLSWELAVIFKNNFFCVADVEIPFERVCLLLV